MYFNGNYVLWYDKNGGNVLNESLFRYPIFDLFLTFFCEITDVEKNDFTEFVSFYRVK